MTTLQDPEGTTTTVSYIDEYNDVIEKPPGPLMGFWSMRYIDRVRVVKIMAGHFGIGKESRLKQYFRQWPTKQPAGTDFPSLNLETTSGSRVNTADFKGKKHFVLMFGAIT